MRNWAGNIAFRASHVAAPSSVDELRALVAGNSRVRALGSGHSFNEIADTDGLLVSPRELPRAMVVDLERSEVTVSAGLRYSDLCPRLHREGFALHNLGSLPHISVAGSVSTATHGSGTANGNLATAVTGVQLVTADGDLAVLRRDSDPDRFPGAVVGLGALGVVTSLTLAVEPAYQVRQHVYERLPWDAALDNLDSVLAAGHSVSLFTTWRAPWFDQVWVKARLPEASPVGQSLFGATPADGPRHPVPGISPDNCTEQLGRPGGWHERLPHFRPDATPSVGAELQAEYLLPRKHAASGLAALERVRPRVASVLQVCEIRAIAADDLWLSPSYDRETVGIHFTWIDDIDAVRPVLELVETELAPFEPRPHWGKLFAAIEVGSRYPRLADFRALAKTFDPGSKFRNSFLDQHIFH